VGLVEQWERIESGLDPRWSEVWLSLRVEPEHERERAAALLAPAGSGLAADTVRFAVSRGGGIGPEAARRLLGRIEREGIDGELTLLSVRQADAPPQVTRPALAAEWRAALEPLPSDWSDLLVELDLDSSADLERAALLCAPLNPTQTSGRPGFRLRCASRRGYGASAGMVGRCLARLDEAGIGGHVRVVRVLSDVNPVGTQGALLRTGRRPA
jgi:hypothetical protein